MEPKQPALEDDLTLSLFEEWVDKPRLEAPSNFGSALMGLTNVKGLGRKGIATLLQHFSSNIKGIFSADGTVLRGILQHANVASSERIAKDILERSLDLFDLGAEQSQDLAKRNIHIISREDFPLNLKRVPSIPIWLFVQGNVRQLHQRPCVAVVGTRKPSPAGRGATELLTRLMAAYEITLVSGLAEGIDEAAHDYSLKYGTPNIAFLGHGINEHYPPSTTDLRERIVEQHGAVVSQYLPNEHSQKQYFVERNRLQAALADVVIPVEAEAKSGTAHTVNFAKECDRRIIGLQWEGSNGVGHQLQQEKREVFQIFKTSERKKLDAIFRSLAEDAGRETYSLSLAERFLGQEVGTRNVDRSDLARLLLKIRKIRRGAKNV